MQRQRGNLAPKVVSRTQPAKRGGQPAVVQNKKQVVNQGNNHVVNQVSKQTKIQYPPMDYAQLLVTLQKQDTPYLDNDFPAQGTSLIQDFQNIDKLDGRLQQWKNLVWKRVVDLWDHRGDIMKIEQGQVDTDGLCQGQLGNCYFMTVVLLLSQRAERVHRLIRQQPVSGQGVYECHFYKDGERVQVIIDDLLPSYNNKPAFAKARNPHALYGLLLEKAWAKLHGSYERIESGLSFQVMRSLTGAPAYEKSPPQLGQFEKEVVDALDRGYLLAFSSKEKYPPSIDTMGIIPHHSFGAVDYLQVQSQGKKVTLLRLVNPYGHSDYRGPFSASSPLWDQAGVSMPAVPPGHFFMPTPTIHSLFSKMQVCKVRDDSQYFAGGRVGTHKDSMTIQAFRIDQGGEYCLTISQPDVKCFREFRRGQQDNYAPGRVVLLREEEGRVDYVTGGVIYTTNRDQQLETHLHSGHYYLGVELQSDSGFSWSLYGQGHPQNLPPPSLTPQQFLDHMVHGVCRLMDEHHTLESAPSLSPEQKHRLAQLTHLCQEWSCQRSQMGEDKTILKYRALLKCAYGFMCFKNESTHETYLEDKAKFAEPKGITSTSLKIYMGNFRVEVKPKTHNIALLKFDLDHFVTAGKVNMNYKYQMAIKSNKKKPAQKKNTEFPAPGFGQGGIIQAYADLE